MFARGEDLNIVLGGTHAECSHVPHNIAMILIFILEETHEAYNYFGTEMARMYFNKRNKPDVLEVVTQHAVIAIQGRTLSLRVEASGYGTTHTALLQN
jgi:hypothetical protein